MLNAATLLRTARGLGRYAARKGVPLGTAYLADCRSYGIQGTYAEYAEAYEAERGEAEAEGRAIVFWLSWVSAWSAVARQYTLDRARSKLGERRRSPYYGARDAIWAANHGKAVR